MDGILVYLIFVCENLKSFLVGKWAEGFTFVGVVGIILYVAYTAIKIFDNTTIESEEDKANYERFAPKIRKIGIIFLALGFSMQLFGVLLPNVKQAAAIYIVPKIVNNEDVSQLPGNIAKLANEGVKSLIRLTKDDIKDGIKKAAEETTKAVKNVTKTATKEGEKATKDVVSKVVNEITEKNIE